MPLPKTEIPGHLQRQLSSRGIRMTSQRRAILSVIETASKHLDASQILRKAQNLGGMNVAGMPEADVTSQHRGAAKVHFSGLQDYCLVERQMAEFVVFAEEDAEQDGVARNLHG